MSIETIRVYRKDKEIGFVQVIVGTEEVEVSMKELPKFKKVDTEYIEDIYNLCTWDKWLNEKPLGVNLKEDISCVDKDKLVFMLNTKDSFKFNSLVGKWENTSLIGEEYTK